MSIKSLKEISGILEEGKKEELFIGNLGGGDMFLDKNKEVNGDYKRIAFIPNSSETLTIYDKKSSLVPDIIKWVKKHKKINPKIEYKQKKK